MNNINSFFLTIIFFLDTCREIYGEDLLENHRILHSYQGFIDQLLTQIHHISLKFNHWWSFKPNCALQKYLLEHEIILDEYFSSDALCNALYHLFDLKNLHHENNKDILVLTSSLQL